jgi:hypothetical protein
LLQKLNLVLPERESPTGSPGPISVVDNTCLVGKNEAGRDARWVRFALSKTVRQFQRGRQELTNFFHRVLSPLVGEGFDSRNHVLKERLLLLRIGDVSERG